MPPLVRRQPFLERIKAYLDPYDFLLWLSEEINDDAFEEFLNRWAFTVGILLNILCILLRGASSSSSSSLADPDIFADDGTSRNGWFGWTSTVLLCTITTSCCVNTYFVIFSSKRYRLFEQPLDIPPITPSARKVHLNSDEVMLNPWTLFYDFIARVRGHEVEQTEDLVWEISVWDPKPSQLTLFTLFSPGHILLFYSVLPAGPLHPRPSMIALFAISSAAVLSISLTFLKRAFESQIRDKAVVQGQVLNEYDIKYVRPSLNHLVRDVAVQTRESSLGSRGVYTREVETYTPTGRISSRTSKQLDSSLSGSDSPSIAHQAYKDQSNPVSRRRSLMPTSMQKPSRVGRSSINF